MTIRDRLNQAASAAINMYNSVAADFNAATTSHDHASLFSDPRDDTAFCYRCNMVITRVPGIRHGEGREQ